MAVILGKNIVKVEELYYNKFKKYQRVLIEFLKSKEGEISIIIESKPV